MQGLCFDTHTVTITSLHTFHQVISGVTLILTTATFKAGHLVTAKTECYIMTVSFTSHGEETTEEYHDGMLSYYNSYVDHNTVAS